MAGIITKLFVSNLSEGCTPWELRMCMESFGEISGTFVAKKRDKFGNRFGFVSFKDVANRQELLNSLKGVKMGECRLKINIARFAAENSGMVGSVPEKARVPGGIHAKGSSYAKLGDQQMVEQTVIVPDRTSAFQELAGLALVGRTVNLETLVDFDRLLNIAKVVVANVQGGLTLLISFHDKDSATRFLESKSLWGPWFSRLERSIVSSRESFVVEVVWYSAAPPLVGGDVSGRGVVWQSSSCAKRVGGRSRPLSL
ncbi:putative RNA recognition motif domain, nucleotide-binding alpha-beta plait domain superfamily [Helianthus annuus]|nr:putative RNA recognition motif domain, nucleotide-binding alpha-beta plait domain superfamily [Helianthus annuus]